MNTTQLPEFPVLQEAIYRVALSLDSFLVNGLQYGVLERVTADGFLEKVASKLQSDLASLEEQARQAPGASPSLVTEILAGLRANCESLVELVRGLSSFRTLPLEQVQSTVAQIPRLREASVRQIEELEGCWRTPRPFYQTRPAHATTAVNDFLANLERIFTEEWSASGPG